MCVGDGPVYLQCCLCVRPALHIRVLTIVMVEACIHAHYDNWCCHVNLGHPNKHCAHTQAGN